MHGKYKAFSDIKDGAWLWYYFTMRLDYECPQASLKTLEGLYSITFIPLVREPSTVHYLH